MKKAISIILAVSMMFGMVAIHVGAEGSVTVDGVKYRMERFCVEERTFSIQHYLFPIRQSELQKTPTIEQNPGW